MTDPRVYLIVLLGCLAFLGLGPWLAVELRNWRDRRFRTHATHKEWFTRYPDVRRSPCQWPDCRTYCHTPCDSVRTLVLHSADYRFAMFGGHFTRGKHGEPMHQGRTVIVDDAVPRVNYWAKCKRFNPHGPTPCLCCPAECTG